MNILITGGAGFIGSHVVRHFVTKYPDYKVVNLDALTYAGNLSNLSDIENFKNYEFVKGDITNSDFIKSVFKKYRFDSVINLAAESHVDNSIENPIDFVLTNVVGTVNLLNSFKFLWDKKGYLNKRFFHVSTDEVFGSLGAEGFFTEISPYNPRSPYSASKASSDHFVRAYGETFGLNYVISNCSNNYGEFQFPEKLIPLFINNILNNKELPIYGDGNYTRDWLYVKDHARAIDLIFHNGLDFESYNIGSNNEWKNIDLVKLLCNLMDKKLGKKTGSSEKLIKFVKDRPGHDKRYAIDSTKLNQKLDWSPKVNFEDGLSLTVDWYIKNNEWLRKISSGEYMNYYNLKN